MRTDPAVEGVGGGWGTATVAMTTIRVEHCAGAAGVEGKNWERPPWRRLPVALRAH